MMDNPGGRLSEQKEDTLQKVDSVGVVNEVTTAQSNRMIQHKRDLEEQFTEEIFNKIIHDTQKPEKLSLFGNIQTKKPKATAYVFITIL